MSIPVTRQEIIALGARVPSEAVIAEIDRLLPIAEADRAVLEAGGYSPARLEELRSYRDTLTREVTARRAQRAEKERAREIEIRAITHGKRILRAAVVMAEAAILQRLGRPDEPPELTQRIARDLEAALETTQGRIDLDSVKLRTRLRAVATVLRNDAIAPSDDERPARTAMIERVEAAEAELAGLTQEKRSAQYEAIAQTEALDELDGRAYLNLRILTKIGRAQWQLAGDFTRAAIYRLTLDDPRPKRRTAPEPTPA